MRPQALVLYTQLLRLIRRLPTERRAEALQEARGRMRAGREATAPDAQVAGLRELAARIGFLRIVTPRVPGEVAGEAGTFVLQDGQLVESQAAQGPGRRVADRRAHARTHGVRTTRALAAGAPPC